MTSNHGRGGSIKSKKDKTSLSIAGKTDAGTVKTALAGGVVVNKGPAGRVRMVKNSPRRPFDKNQIKLSRIKMAVENGLYRVDADSVAESMIERFLESILACPADHHSAHAGRKH